MQNKLIHVNPDGIQKPNIFIKRKKYIIIWKLTVYIQVYVFTIISFRWIQYHIIQYNVYLATFQCWLQLVVFHLKGDFLLNFVLILIILNLSLWVLHYTVKLWNDHFWTTLGYSFTCYQPKFHLLKNLSSEND